MALNLFKPILFLLFAAIVAASDPDILTDFIVPENITNVDGNFFTYTGLRGIFDSGYPPNFKGTKVSLDEFPALNGQGVSASVLQFPPRSLNALHSNSRASGLMFVLAGTLEVGFVDTTNKLFTQTVQKGDMFMFPKGLVHYQYNADENVPAMAIASFGSASAGTFYIPNTAFGVGIEDDILAKSFKTDVATVRKIKAALAVKA